VWFGFVFSKCTYFQDWQGMQIKGSHNISPVKSFLYSHSSALPHTRLQVADAHSHNYATIYGSFLNTTNSKMHSEWKFSIKVSEDFEENSPSAPDIVPLIPVPLQRQRILCHALDHRELRNQSSVGQNDSLSVSGEGVLFAFCFGHCSHHHCQMCRQMMGPSSSESKCCTPSADEEEPPSCNENKTATLLWGHIPFCSGMTTGRKKQPLQEWLQHSHSRYQWLISGGKSIRHPASYTSV